MKTKKKKNKPARKRPTAKAVGKKVNAKAKAFQLMKRGREVFLKVWK